MNQVYRPQKKECIALYDVAGEGQPEVIDWVNICPHYNEAWGVPFTEAAEQVMVAIGKSAQQVLRDIMHQDDKPVINVVLTAD